MTMGNLGNFSLKKKCKTISFFMCCSQYTSQAVVGHLFIKVLNGINNKAAVNNSVWEIFTFMQDIKPVTYFA